MLPVSVAYAQAGDAQQTTIEIFVAGSLCALIGAAARAFEAAHPGVVVRTMFGAPGLLRERIEQSVNGSGADAGAADMFASRTCSTRRR